MERKDETQKLRKGRGTSDGDKSERYRDDGYRRGFSKFIIIFSRELSGTR